MYRNALINRIYHSDEVSSTQKPSRSITLELGVQS